MDRVREERDGARDEDDAELEHGGDAQRHERDLDRPDPPLVARERGVERIRRVVAVAHDGGDHSGQPPGGVGVAVSVIAVTALDVVVVRRVDVVRVRAVIVRMIRPVRRRRLVLVRTRPIAHVASVRQAHLARAPVDTPTAVHAASRIRGMRSDGAITRVLGWRDR